MSSTHISRVSRPRVRVALSLVALLATSVVSACSSSSQAASTGGASTSAASTLRLGYFANLTHATAVLGVKDGHFAKALGTTTLQTQVFNAGPAAVEALLAGAIDAAYVGPSPAINATQSPAVRRSALSPAARAEARRSSSSRASPKPPWRARRSRRPSWVAPKTSPCGPGSPHMATRHR